MTVAPIPSSAWAPPRLYVPPRPSMPTRWNCCSHTAPCDLKLMPTYRHLKDDRGSDPILGMGATPLVRAAKAFDADALELLLSHGALRSEVDADLSSSER